ncbi:MAG: glycosyltransferase family 4 protein [Bryobacteraceae bacterium]|jgi:glycosyltransferase involved in cell wall biosynthesis
MTVLELISSEGYYGAESMLVALAQALSRVGWEPIVGVLADRRFAHTEVAEEAERLGLRTEVLPCGGRWDRQAVRRLRGLTIERGVDVVHAHGYKADFYAAAARWPRRTALVATCHNWPNRLPAMRAYAALDRLVLRTFDEVATASPVVAGTLKRWGVGATLVENGVDVERFRGAEPSLRQELGHGSGRVVGFVGRMVPAKGGAVLLEAAESVLAVFPDTTFVLAGEGPARSEWEALAARLGIAGNVVFAGVRRDMPGVYASFDVLALPSYEENMPMCLLEAMAAGTPAIATRVGAVPKLILPDETGVLIEPGDAPGLAAAILRLLRDPGEARRLGANGQAHAERGFSAAATARRYAALYERALAGEGRVGAPGWQRSGT